MSKTDGMSKGFVCNEAMAADFAVLQLSFVDRWGAWLLGIDGKAMSDFLFYFPMTIEWSATQPWVTGLYSWWNLLRPRELRVCEEALWALGGCRGREILQSMQCFKTLCLLFQHNSRPSSLCRLCLTPSFDGWAVRRWLGGSLKWFCQGWDTNILIQKEFLLSKLGRKG